MATWEVEAMHFFVFFAKYTLHLPYIYPIFLYIFSQKWPWRSTNYILLIFIV